MLRTITEGLKAALLLLFMPIISAILLATDRGMSSEPLPGIWRDLWIRVWERAGTLMRVRVDTIVLVSSGFMGCCFFALLLDPHYLERYSAFDRMKDYLGGRPFWMAATGVVCLSQFVTAFAYGMRGMNIRLWERACILTTGVAAGGYIVMAELISWKGPTIVSNACYLAFAMNFLFGIKFGLTKGVAQSRKEIEPYFAHRKNHKSFLIIRRRSIP